MAALSTTQQAKQGARHMLAVGADKFKLASGQIGRGETMVRPEIQGSQLLTANSTQGHLVAYSSHHHHWCCTSVA